MRNSFPVESFSTISGPASPKRRPRLLKSRKCPAAPNVNCWILTISLFLFGLLNPVVDSIRGLCAASHLKRVQEDMQKGETIDADRYYGLDYGFLEELRKLGISFVFRIRNKPRMEIVEELPLTAADRAAGVAWQGMVNLGNKWQGTATGHRFRN